MHIQYLVFSYATKPRPAKWIKKLFNKLGPAALTDNPFGIDYLLDRHELLDDRVLMLLSHNCHPRSIRFIEEYTHLAKPEYISRNPHALKFLETHRDMVDQHGLCKNPSPEAAKFFDYKKILRTHQYPTEVLGSIPWAFDIFIKHFNKYYTSDFFRHERPELFGFMSSNRCDQAIKFILDAEKINPNIGVIYAFIGANPRAYPYIAKYINDPSSDWVIIRNLWEGVCANPNPEITKLINLHPEYIDWAKLSGNPTEPTVDILLQNPARVVLSGLASNTNPRILPLLSSLVNISNINEISDILGSNPLIFETKINLKLSRKIEIF